MKRQQIRYILLSIVLLVGIITIYERNMSCVYADTIQYTYDSLGRVKTAVYSNGTKMTYIYDKNGNIEKILEDKIEVPGEPQDGTIEDGKVDVEDDVNNNEPEEDIGSDENENNVDSDGDVGSNENESNADSDDVVSSQGDESNTDSDNGTIRDHNTDNNTQKPNLDFVQINGEIPSLRFLLSDISKRDVYAYNQFKKKKPVVKSLKIVKKNSAFHLKIQVRRLKNLTLYPETGYQIKYATNNQFKKASTITVKRNNKKTLTAKTWKVKKKKTYYVKVRAYLKTRKGKNIYTKFSKVNKIMVE